jgi:hypothetical protein
MCLILIVILFSLLLCVGQFWKHLLKYETWMIYIISIMMLCYVLLCSGQTSKHLWKVKQSNMLSFDCDIIFFLLYDSPKRICASVKQRNVLNFH